MIQLLSTLETSAADYIIRAKAKELSNGQIAPSLHLDILEAAAKRNMADELAGFESSRPSDSSTAIFMETLEGGDAEAGRIVAGTHLAAQCIRCHRFGREDGSEIGPNLGRIAREKDRDYLLRSLVDPGADIAEGYGVSTITLKSGSSISGQLGKETKKGIDLILADGSTQKIATEDVASKTDPISSMPPMGYLLTKRELRDVVAYLASLE